VHELGMSEGILDAALRRAAGRKLVRVTVRVGRLHRAVDEALVQGFELVATGTEADGAELEVVQVPVSVVCQAAGCGRRTDSEEPLAACPACGSTDVVLDGGDELLLESIELAPGEEPVAHAVFDRGPQGGQEGQEGAAHVPGHSG
jgi:hydrogenase nickel incorporation protein HypA/HybF